MIKYIFLVCALSIVACTSPSTPETTTTQEEKIVLKKTPPFEADSAYYFIQKQVDFGKRVPNTPAHEKCAEYLAKTLQKYNFEVQTQKFEAVRYDGVKLKSFNIIGSFNPKASKRILLAAHWDSRAFDDKEQKDTTKYKPIDGANDGGSGVGVLLEIARTLHKTDLKLPIGVDIIFFDSEDQGTPEGIKNSKPDTWCLGSQYWAKNKHKENYTAYFGILLDMVGAKGAKFYKEGTSMQYAGDITQKVWNLAGALGYGQIFVNKNCPAITDDHTYVNQIAKIPMLDIVEFDDTNEESFFANYHHTSKDNMEIIDKKTLKAVGETILQILYQENPEM
jgi:Zn-dependent M28 family amino/carboxypeptidase